jgi:hypothetical protein
MNKLLKFLGKNKLTLVSGFFITLMLIAIFFGDAFVKNKIKSQSSKIKYEESFDANTVPKGRIIYIHGIPKYREDEYYEMDSAFKYRKYEVGIWNDVDRKVYMIIVPYYAIGLFRLGDTINKNKYHQKRNPYHDNYVYPKKEEFYIKIKII